MRRIDDDLDEAYYRERIKYIESIAAKPKQEPLRVPNPSVLAANEIQVAGTHYKDLKIQTWDYIVANNLGYLEGNIIKYVSRHKTKGGIEDLKKAKHYLEKLIEVESK
jgi:hypothetical protein